MCHSLSSICRLLYKGVSICSLTLTFSVNVAAESSLSLSKTAKNVTQNGIEAINITALPGDIVEYTLYFSNTTTTPISNIKIKTMVPTYTVAAQAIDCMSALLPDTLTCKLPDNVYPRGYQGQIEWQLEGALLQGEGGKVSYQIRVK